MNIVKRFNLILSALGVISAVLFSSGLANAAGSASFSLSTSSGSFTKGTKVTLSLYENSGSVPINAVQANVGYDASKLQLIYYASSGGNRSADFSGSAFALVAEASGGSGHIKLGAGVAAGAPALTGKQLVAKITFKVLAGSGSTSLSYEGGSAIVDANDYTNNVWNGNTSGGSFGLKSPPTSSGGTTSKPSTGSSTPKSSTSKPSTTTTVTPTEEKKQKANPSEPVAASLNSAESGDTFLVAIKVFDSNGKPVKGATVSLGDSSAQTDNSGVAGFVGIAAGTYEVVAKTGNKVLGKSTITVDGSKGTVAVQQFEIKAKKKLNWNLIAGVGILILAIIVILGLWRGGKSGHNRKLASDHHGLDGSAQPGPASGDQSSPAASPTVITGGTPTPKATTSDENLLKPTVISPNGSNPKS